MEITIYAKKRHSKDGKAFYTYLTSLTRKDGTTLKCSVKFRSQCGEPKADDCPMNIVFKKEDANLATREYTDNNTGEIMTSHTLWLSEWGFGNKFVDTSMDDFV